MAIPHWLLVLGAWALACGAAPDNAEQTGTKSTKSSVAAPIKHVVVIVKENHTLDHYFGSFAGANGTLNAPSTSARPGIRRSS